MGTVSEKVEDLVQGLEHLTLRVGNSELSLPSP